MGCFGSWAYVFFLISLAIPSLLGSSLVMAQKLNLKFWSLRFIFWSQIQMPSGLKTKDLALLFQHHCDLAISEGTVYEFMLVRSIKPVMSLICTTITLCKWNVYNIIRSVSEITYIQAMWIVHGVALQIIIESCRLIDNMVQGIHLQRTQQEVKPKMFVHQIKDSYSTAKIAWFFSMVYHFGMIFMLVISLSHWSEMFLSNSL